MGRLAVLHQDPMVRSPAVLLLDLLVLLPAWAANRVWALRPGVLPPAAPMVLLPAALRPAAPMVLLPAALRPADHPPEDHRTAVPPRVDRHMVDRPPASPADHRPDRQAATVLHPAQAAMVLHLDKGATVLRPVLQASVLHRAPRAARRPQSMARLRSVCSSRWGLLLAGRRWYALALTGLSATFEIRSW